jgi:hypothetical protein
MNLMPIAETLSETGIKFALLSIQRCEINYPQAPGNRGRHGLLY